MRGWNLKDPMKFQKSGDKSLISEFWKLVFKHMYSYFAVSPEPPDQNS